MKKALVKCYIIVVILRMLFSVHTLVMSFKSIIFRLFLNLERECVILFCSKEQFVITLMKISFYKAVEADTLITNIFIMKKIFWWGVALISMLLSWSCSQKLDGPNVDGADVEVNFDLELEGAWELAQSVMVPVQTSSLGQFSVRLVNLSMQRLSRIM